MKSFSYSIFSAIGAGATAAILLQSLGLIASAPSGVAPAVTQAGRLIMAVGTPAFHPPRIEKP